MAERFKLELAVGGFDKLTAGGFDKLTAGGGGDAAEYAAEHAAGAGEYDQGGQSKWRGVSGGCPFAAVGQRHVYQPGSVAGTCCWRRMRWVSAGSALRRPIKAAPEKEQAKATENLARVMKAEDGTVGRANAFVLSLRPKPVAAAATGPQTQPVQ